MDLWLTELFNHMNFTFPNPSRRKWSNWLTHRTTWTLFCTGTVDRMVMRVMASMVAGVGYSARSLLSVGRLHQQKKHWKSGFAGNLAGGRIMRFTMQVKVSACSMIWRWSFGISLHKGLARRVAVIDLDVHPGQWNSGIPAGLMTCTFSVCTAQKIILFAKFLPQ